MGNCEASGNAPAPKIEPLVELRKLSKHFDRAPSLTAGAQSLPAVRGVSLRIPPGETLGLVGESGCGKSTLGRMAAGLLEPSGGDVFINGLPLWDKKAHADYRAFRRSLAGVVQMVFQDPYASLDPRMSIGDSIAEPLLCSRRSTNRGSKPAKDEIRGRVRAMLRKVGLEADAAARRPHEFSGGQRQRVAVARALITGPAFVVCDEPTSSLDASVQSQVLNLLLDLQDEFGVSYLFISHDLAVVRHMSDRIAVMRKGRLVEEGDADRIFFHPAEDYTRLLLEAST
ncbi:MAG: ATP-binding cassette domain-containing protein [Desulfovibrio sp.]|jgi:ABC-type glutathione transport system ATPase component|nr:ATP-binding cassette domain-containing protein [Desulfovibrio sp.]